MRLISGVRACVFVLLVAAVTRHSQAIHDVVGTPPQISVEQEVVVVFTNDSLVLSCEATGDPTPTVAWYRGGVAVDDEYVLDNGTLLIPNITEGGYASRGGVVYYCTATNTLGEPGYNATIRSRDITVYFAYFGGFDSVEPRFLPSANTSDFAMECLVGDSQPTPKIEWFEGSSSVPLVADDDVIYLEDGRFLYIRNAITFPRDYCCVVTNALIDQRVEGTQYTVNGTGLVSGESYVYKEIGDRTAFVGQGQFEFSYIAASGLFDQTCVFHVGETDVFARGGVGQWSDVELPGDGTNMYELSCRNNGIRIGTGTLTVFDNAMLTSSPADDREVLVGQGSVSFSCPSTGTPSPTLEWFFNGDSIDSSSAGFTITGDVLSIDSHQVSHSGAYQCVVSNGVSEARASWVLEVREPVSPNPLEFNVTVIGAEEDRRVGTLYVRDPESEVTVSAMVEADPCPTVQWRFEGSEISDGADYTLSDSCGGSSPFNFSLTVRNITSATSGTYSANFSNFAGSDILPPLYITIPVPSDDPVSSVSLSVIGDSSAQCLLNGSDVTITCNTNGFPRPNVRFNRGVALITPGVGAFSKYSQLFADQLLITGVDESDAGPYLCLDNNGNSSMSTQFEFCTKPVLRNIMSSSNTFVGNQLTVECEFEGTPPPTITWTKDGNPLVESQGSLEIISPQSNRDISRVVITRATSANAGVYTCLGLSVAGSDSGSITVDVQADQLGLPLAAIIGIAAGGAGLILVIVLVILLLVCVYMCARKSRDGGEYNMPYNVSAGKSYTDYSADPRGNVDKDSDEEDGGQPEAFNPEYESLPALRPSAPPTYKPTPSYPHGAPLSGDDIEMMKVPPPDTDSFVDAGPPYRRDNGVPDYGRPGPDDFLSEDAQFV